MELWNEYEGRSIDGVFPLERLLRPEGRSAFFSTTIDSGTPTVIRLIESHFDEDEILARWSGVSQIDQPNLLTLERFGHAMMDETSLVYVVMEPVEADLSEILCERPLTNDETRQIAVSLIPALQALHARGFIHEHIQPANVLAVGDVVKLRSDCIREAPEGDEGDALRTRDVQDLASLLLETITLQRNLKIGSHYPPLPDPFREIIHNGLSGSWSLSQMLAALNANEAPAATASEAEERPLVSATAAPAQPQHDALEEEAAGITDTFSHSYPLATPAANEEDDEAADESYPTQDASNPSPRWRVPLAIVALCLLVIAGWALTHRHSGTEANVAQSAVLPAPPAAPAPQTAAPAPIVTEATATEQPGRDSWRVVAYTYNKESQAIAKAQTLERHYGSLHPEVFSPTGRAPFLVTLGGPLSREAAFALKSKLRGRNLPRDIYARNYSSKGR